MFGARLAVDPGRTAALLVFVAGGIGLGIASGLVPGLHANTMALLLGAVAPALPGPPVLVGATMLAAGVVHTFLDAVPALALGVPDPAMAASALPGHRLVIEGRGREALRLSALGSGLAVVFAVPLAVPVTRVMVAVYPVVEAHLPVVLGAVAALLVVTEPSLAATAGAALATAASGVLGLATLDLSVSGPLGGSVLMPLFAGLFGVPVLLDALAGGGVPPQDDPAVSTPPRTVALLGFVGSLCGAAVGYLPGVSSAVAAALALLATPGSHGARGFLVTTSGVNTANTVFALFALVALGSPRTGVLVALEGAGVPVELSVLLPAVGFAAVAGFLLVPRLGDAYLQFAAEVSYARLSVAVLGLLVVLAYLLAGPTGVALLAAAAVVGHVPVVFEARRANLMGVLVWPLAL